MSHWVHEPVRAVRAVSTDLWILEISSDNGMPLLKATDGMHKEKQGLDAHNKTKKTVMEPELMFLP